jgi:hypothetical protein
MCPGAVRYGMGGAIGFQMLRVEYRAGGFPRCNGVDIS